VIRLTCVDNDVEALQFVQRNVMPAMPHHMQVNFVRYNALRMTSAKANVERFGKNDIIYSVGLCDYIPDDYLIPMLRGWRESLAEGGVVYVAFKDCELYDKTEYQWLTDWYFYQRTTADCRRLFQQAGYDMEQLVESRTEMDVIINFIGRASQARSSSLRTDEAERASAPHMVRVGVDAR
jgi:extracellular factor (EF) 3-hydroxypalmitic acid methyl ester biosynthesis protein